MKKKKPKTEAEIETDLKRLPGTGAVAGQFGMTEAQINSILRRRGEIRPPIVSNRRRWRKSDIDALRDYLA
jgi:hypothetical protein